MGDGRGEGEIQGEGEGKGWGDGDGESKDEDEGSVEGCDEGKGVTLKVPSNTDTLVASEAAANPASWK